jgi:hypothetical protein
LYVKGRSERIRIEVTEERRNVRKGKTKRREKEMNCDVGK